MEIKDLFLKSIKMTQRKNEISVYLDIPFLTSLVINYDYFITELTSINIEANYTTAITVSNNNIAYGFNNDIIIFNVNSLKIITLKGHKKQVTCLYSKETKLISGSKDKTIRIWDSDFKCFKILKGHKKSIKDIIIFNDKIISVDESNILIWEQNSRNFLSLELSDHIYLGITDGKIITRRRPSDIQIWNLEGQQIATYDHKLDSLSAFLLTSDKIITGYETGDILSLENGKIRALIGHKSQISVFCLISQDIFVSGTVDGEIIIWEKDQIKHKITMETTSKKYSNVISNIAKLPNNNIIVTSHYSVLNIYDIETGQLANILWSVEPNRLLVVGNKLITFNHGITIWE